jgi:hypothetical protein
LVSGAGRQNVALACQLLSSSVARDLKAAGDPDSLAVAEFCKLMNDWFDVFDSSCNKAKKNSAILKSPYGLHLQQQNKVLDDTIEILSNLRTINKKGETKNALQVFQKAIILNCKSLKGLFNDLNKDYGIEYIETKNLNSDALENVFSQLKIKGMNDLPSPMEFLHREKLFFLGKNTSSLKTHKNTNERTDPEQNSNFAFLIGNEMKNLMKKLAEENTICSDESCGDDEELLNEPLQKLIKLEETESNNSLKFKILCGVVAAKLVKRFPYVCRTSKETPLPESKMITDSKGIPPSEDFLILCTKLETFFEQYHGSSFKAKEKPISSLIREIENLISSGNCELIEKEIMVTFYRSRVLQRIRQLNINRRDGIKQKSAENKEVREKKKRKLSTEDLTNIESLRNYPENKSQLQKKLKRTTGNKSFTFS